MEVGPVVPKGDPDGVMDWLTRWMGDGGECLIRSPGVVSGVTM